LPGAFTGNAHTLIVTQFNDLFILSDAMQGAE
jgi:hypothetical protein